MSIALGASVSVERILRAGVPADQAAAIASRGS